MATDCARLIEETKRAAFVIHFDLNKGNRRDCQTLYGALLKSKAVRATESTWFLSTTWSAIQARDKMRQCMHPKDLVSVNAISVNSGFASDESSKAAVGWTRQHLSAKQIGIKTQ